MIVYYCNCFSVEGYQYSTNFGYSNKFRKRCPADIYSTLFKFFIIQYGIHVSSQCVP